MLRGTLAIALVALTVSACSVSRQATAVKSEELKVKSEVRDSLRVEQVMVAVHDTLTITKTITIRENEQGNTVRMSVVTDRDRVRDRSQLRDKSEKLIVRVDTVYVERRDSVLVKSEELRVKSDRPSAFVSAFKWVFWIIVAIGALIMGWKVCKVFKFLV